MLSVQVGVRCLGTYLADQTNLSEVDTAADLCVQQTPGRLTVSAFVYWPS